MKKIFILILLTCISTAPILALGTTGKQSNNDPEQTETIILIRHGEKPQGGLGQLSCKGLNRALSLPKVLLGKFGKPQYIFAPNPTEKVDDAKYFYVRPLVTIEPTAIYCGLPVNTQYGYLEIQALQNELLEPRYSNSTIFVAWEHGLQDLFAKKMVKYFGGDIKDVPEWSNDEYDMIFIFKITTVNGQKKFSFTVDHEGLNNVKDGCPL